MDGIFCAVGSVDVWFGGLATQDGFL